MQCSQRLRQDPPALDLSSLGVSRDSAICNGLLAARNALQDGHALLHEMKGLYVQQICAGEAMLRDEDGLFVPLDVSEELSSLPLESGDEFGAHAVIL